jgi:hypothetical protein
MPASNIFKIKECELVPLLYIKEPDTTEAVSCDNESVFVWALFRSLRKTFAVEYPLKNCSVALNCAWILRISAYKEKKVRN